MSNMLQPDLIFRNARIIDGTGSPSTTGDLAVSGDRLLDLGEIGNLHGEQEIDIEGRAVCPGFVDTHTHDDRVLLTDPNMNCKVSQGVTTVVTGNCGISLAPLKMHRRPPAPLDLLGRHPDEFFHGFADYLKALDDDPPSLNAICQVGHTTLRASVMDSYDSPATSVEIGQMGDMLEKSLEAGSCGMSTGLFYPPAHAAPTGEVLVLSGFFMPTVPFIPLICVMRGTG